MTITRAPHDRRNPYAQINREIFSDPNLSWESKGLISYLISLPDDWKIQVSHLASIYKGYGGGEKAIYKMLSELIEQGYCEKIQNQDNGRFLSIDYHIYEFKKSLPLRQQRRAEHRHAETRHLTKEENKNKKENNNKGAAAPNPAVVVPDFIQEIEDLTDEEKTSLAKYPEDRVKLALEFNKKVKPTHSKIQQLIWHCKAVIPPKPSKTNQKNNLYEYCVDFFKSNTSKRCEVEIHKDCIYFIPREGADAKPIEIRFTQEGCTEEIKKMCHHYCFMNHKKSIREK